MENFKFYVPATMAHVSHDTDAPMVCVKVGETGYWPIYTNRSADELNGPGVGEDVLLAAVVGSMFGWRVPGAQLAVWFSQKPREIW